LIKKEFHFGRGWAQIINPDFIGTKYFQIVICENLPAVWQAGLRPNLVLWMN